MLSNKPHYRMSPSEHEESGAGVTFERVYLREYESVCSACPFDAKERWLVENVRK